MARRSRDDFPGSWHHVTNRAVARRPMFEATADVRYFLACVARAVRRGQIRVHAWCVMTTHFHLLVQSPNGELSAAMRRIQNTYARHFNRKRRRDGPLLRGRFLSKPVTSLTYRRTLWRYIDVNPVQAGLCLDPRTFAWCSAHQYAARRGPRWLTRTWIEAEVAARNGHDDYDPGDYPGAWNTASWQHADDLVAARARANVSRDDLDSLLAMATPEVADWLRRGAIHADGAVAAMPPTTARAVETALAAARQRDGDWRLGPRDRTGDAWNTMHAGLLHDLARASHTEIARRTGISAVQAGRRVARHRHLLVDDSRYGDVATRLTEEALGAAGG